MSIFVWADGTMDNAEAAAPGAVIGRCRSLGSSNDAHWHYFRPMTYWYRPARKSSFVSFAIYVEISPLEDRAYMAFSDLLSSLDEQWSRT